MLLLLYVSGPLSPRLPGLRAVKLHCTLSLAAQCIVIGPVCLFVGLFVCGSVATVLEIAYIDLHQTGFVGEGSDQLQLIKFWPSRIPGKGVCGGVKIFGSALLQPAHSVCVSPSAFFMAFDVLLFAQC